MGRTKSTRTTTPTNTIADNLLRLQTARTAIATAITNKGGTVTTGDGFEDFPTDIATIPTGSATLITKSIDANGTYNASSDNADGYSSVTVSVPNTYTAGDEGKVVSSGALIAQTARPETITVNGSYITTNYNSVMVNVPTGSTNIDSTCTKPVLDTVATETWTRIRSSGGGTGNFIWTDGTSIYYSSGSTQYVWQPTSLTWATKSWTGLTNFYGSGVWTDGTHIYYNNGNNSYELNGSTWSTKSWTGAITNGSNVWSDGTNIYYSSGTTHSVLDPSTSTWSTQTWTGLSSFNGEDVWTDGTHIYYSSTTSQYVLDVSTGTWSTKTWTDMPAYTYGKYMWTDGTEIYLSGPNGNYVLNKSTSTWSAKTWTGLTTLTGTYIWTDGSNIYHSDGTTDYILVKHTKYTKL